MRRIAIALLVVMTLTAHAAIAAEGAAPVPAGKKQKPKPASPQEPNVLQLLLTSSADPDSGGPPLKVAFETEVYEGDDAVKPKFEWDFGDGSAKSHEQNPTHTYKKVGKYAARVTVKDATGRTGHDDLDIYVEAPE